MKKFIPIIFIIPVLLLSCMSKKKAAQRNQLTVVFYNVENLFDTIDAPDKRDDEFTPDSIKKWGTKRYTKKLKDISKVLCAISPEDLPELIGLCEVENRAVVKELVATGQLADEQYNIVHHESPDIRGIDVALAYRTDAFKVLTHEAIPIRFPDNPKHKTRDILYVKGKARKDVLHIFVNHWPSRIGGTAKSEPNRVYVASVLRHKVDSVFTTDPDANIIIMGDMNDEPANKSISETLNASDNPGNSLYNLMYPLDSDQKGTYNFRGNWNMLDNLIVSNNLLHKKRGYKTAPDAGCVFHQPFMEYHGKKGMSPNRTYGGSNYYGGISDHFPVYVVLKK